MKNQNRNISISVVICTFNGEPYIREQIESILNQTLLPKEIVVGDDGSDDDTILSLEGLRPKIEKKGIRLMVYKHNHLGAHNNFKSTLPLATCPLIAPCDQDDIWLPEKLEKCTLAMMDGVEVVACRNQIQYEDGSMGPVLDHTLKKIRLLWGNTVSGHLMLIKRSALCVFNVAPMVTFDWGLALYAAATGTGALIEDVECIWRRHPGVVTTVASIYTRYPIERLGKWAKLYKSLRLMIRKEYSDPVLITMNNNALIFSRYGHKQYARIAHNMSAQKPYRLLKACWYHAWLCASLSEFRQLSVHDKIGNWCYQFCYPAIWWYEYHTHNSL